MKTCRRPFAPSLIAAAIAASLMAAAPLVAPGALVGQQYGASIAVGGQQVLVGEPGAGALPGVVYVYGRAGGAWGEVGRLSVSAAPGPPDGFGRALAAEGDLVMVGAPAWEDGAGAVFVYRADGRGGWAEAGRLSSGVPGGGFGSSVSLDGGAVLVSAPGEDEGVGAVYLF
ncbi:MAG: hypothetical protein F4059_02015, partial [Gemmatimonadetes bacterium]|nr:hypothetical protein [Gemmatimonadota bacterium]